jgi:hypothetical protein
MDAKQSLQKLIADFQAKQFRDGEAKGLVDTIGGEIKTQLAPLFTGLAQELTDALREAIKDIKVEMPEITFPDIPAPIVNVPAPNVNVPAPVVNVSPAAVHIPETIFPPQMPFPTEFGLRGVDKMKPLPVLMMDVSGRPLQFPGGGGGGGRGDFYTIKDIQNSSGGSIIDNDGNVKVAGSFSVTASNNSTQAIDSSGNPYTQANPFPVVFSSSGTTASAIVDSTGVAYSGSNPLPVTGSFSSTPFATYYASDAVGSTNLIQYGGNSVGTSSELSPGFLRMVHATDVGLSVSATQVGTWNVTSVTNSIAAAMVDSTGVAYSGSNPLPVTGSFSSTPFATYYASDAIGSTNLIQYGGNSVGTSSELSPGFLRMVHATDVGLSVSATQVGTWNVTSVTNSIASALIDSTGVAYSGSNPLPVTGSFSSTPFATYYASDAIGSMNIIQYGGNTVPTSSELTAGFIRMVHATDVGVSVSATQVGTWNVTSITNSLAANIVDSSGIAYSGSNPLPVTFTGAAGTSVSLVNSQGTYYNSDNPFFVATAPTGLNETVAGVMRVTIMTDTAQSANITTFNGNAPATGLNEVTNGVLRVMEMSGNVTSANIVTFNGNAPATGLNETTAGALRMIQMSDNTNSANIVSFNSNTPATGLNETTNGVLRTVTMSDTASSSQAKLVARTTNPTATADGSPAFATSDKLGRQLVRPLQVRDLIKTAYATLSTQAETTIFTATAATFADLVMLTATNASAAAWKVDIRAGTAGNIIHTLNIPANTGPIGFSPSIPWPQDATGNSWTATISSGTDVSNANVFISALFSQEI